MFSPSPHDRTDAPTPFWRRWTKAIGHAGVGDGRPRRVEAAGRLDLTSLEPRILYSVSPMIAGLDVDGFDSNDFDLHALDSSATLSAHDGRHDGRHDGGQDHDAGQRIASHLQLHETRAGSGHDGSSSDQGSVRSIIIIDAAVDDAETLLADIEPDAVVHYLDGDSDGIDQVTDILSRYDALQSLHLLSHGGEGSLLLGSGSVDADNLETYQTALSSWSDSFVEGGDLLLYGCDVAGGDGARFVDSLASWTQLDVAASVDVTGSSLRGGDWDLEYQSGVVTAEAFASVAALNEYQHTLDVVHEHIAAQSDNDVNKVELTFNVDANDELLIVTVAIGHATEADVRSVDFDDGQTLTFLNVAGTEGPGRPQMWHYYIVDPTFGNRTLEVDLDANVNNGVTVTVDSFRNVDKSDVFGNIASEVDFGDAPTLAFDQSRTGLQFSSLAVDNSIDENLTFAGSNDAVELNESFIGHLNFENAIQTKPSGGPDTGVTGWTLDSSEQYVITTFRIHESAPPGTVLTVDTNADYANTDANFGDVSSVAALLSDRGDDGKISLREAIAAANADASLTEIDFDLDVGSNQITLIDGLLIRSETTLDGDNTGRGVVIDGDGSHRTLVLGVQSGGSRIEHLTLQNSSNAGIAIGNSANTVLADNVIIQNLTHGIEMVGGVSDITLIGNRIGIDADGNIAGNGGHGILVAGGSSDIVIGNAFGETIDSSAGNKIVGNGGDGVRVTNGAGGVTIRGNEIRGNGGLNIDLTQGGGGVSPNDGLDDADTGGNGLRNFATIETAIHDGVNLVLQGRSNSNNDTPLIIDLYRTTDASGAHGGSQIYLATTTPNATTNVDDAFDYAAATGIVSAGDRVTALVTDADGNTSEFAINVEVQTTTVDAGANQTIAVGDSLSLQGQTNLTGYGETFHWDINGNAVADAGEPTSLTATLSDSQIQSLGLGAGVHTITLTRTNPDNSTVTDSFQLTIEAPPQATFSDRITVDENQTFVTNLTSDGGPSVTYQIVGGADAALFEISSNELRFRSPPDHEARASDYEVQIELDDGSLTSIQDVAVTVADANDPLVGTAAIVGDAEVGKTLSIDVSNLSDQDGIAGFQYRWQRGGIDILGETNATYELTAVDLGQSISAVVTVSDAASNPPEDAFAAGTDPVAAAPPVTPPVDPPADPPADPGGGTVTTEVADALIAGGGGTIGGGTSTTPDTSADGSGSETIDSGASDGSDDASGSSGDADAGDSGGDGSDAGSAADADGSASTDARNNAALAAGLAQSGGDNGRGGNLIAGGDSLASLGDDAAATTASTSVDDSTDDVRTRSLTGAASADSGGLSAINAGGFTTSTWTQQTGAALTATEVALLVGPGQLWEAMDQNAAALQSTIRGDLVLVGSVGAAASSITVGVLAWAARGGLLVSGLMAQLPAWRSVDPLIVMQHFNSPAGNESLEQMMQRRSESVQTQTETTAASSDVPVVE